MNFLYPKTVWRASDLPDGLSLDNGIISGSPQNKGTFSTLVTVSNPLGADSKHITIIVKNRPGTEKFSILQDGSEIDKVTIPELRAMVQDGTAQTKFNCNDTQIIMPFSFPDISYNLSGEVISIPAHSEDIAINFCDFRHVTLENGSETAGLILQFDKSLWPQASFFDYQTDRWKYSYLRLWLNSAGENWFSKAYSSQLTPEELRNNHELTAAFAGEQKLFSETRGISTLKDFSNCSFLKEGFHGFIDYLPEDLSMFLQNVKIKTYVDQIKDFNDDSIDEPDYVDGYDMDITFDKIFIPDLQELNFFDKLDMPGDEERFYPPKNALGTPWAFYNHDFSYYLSDNAKSTWPNKQLLADSLNNDSRIVNTFYAFDYKTFDYSYIRQLFFLSRSAVICSDNYNPQQNLILSLFADHIYGVQMKRCYIYDVDAQPAPAFVLC